MSDSTGSRRRAARLALAALAAILMGTLAFPTAAHAQKESVRPGINDSFREPDLEQLLGRFERNGREIYDRRHDITAALELRPGMSVADIGAGTGFFARIFAEKVGPKGKVHAVDIAQDLLDHIDEQAKASGIENIHTVLGADRTPNLKPNSVDVVFICDTYHHFEFPFDMMEAIHTALRENGRVVIVDFKRIRGVTSDFSIEHVRCGKGTVMDEVQDCGFTFEREVPIMDEQYLITFVKRPHDFEKHRIR